MAKEEKKVKNLEDLPGVGDATAEKLRKAGYDSFEKIATSLPSELQEIAEIGVETAKKTISSARDALEMGYETADKILERRKMIGRITTGSKELDNLIGGGVETQAITESYGRFSSGKTQICFQLAVNVQRPVEAGGLDGACLYVDTERTFRPERIKQIAESLKLDPEKVLKNIYVAEAVNSDHQMVLVEKAEEIVKEKNIRLIIIDSLTSFFRADYVGRGALSERQQKLNRHIHALQKLADMHNLAIFVTNQVMDDPAILFGDPTKPIGGHVVAHQCLAPNSLVQLSDGEIITIDKMHNPLEVKGIDLDGDMKAREGRCDGVFLNERSPFIYEIESNFTVRASPQHTFFRMDGFGIEEVPASSLKPDDYTAFVKKINIPGVVQKLPSFKQEELVILTEKGSELIRKELGGKGIKRADVVASMNIKRRQLRRILNQKYPTYKSRIEKLVDQFGLDRKILGEVRQCNTNKHHLIKIPAELNPELAEVLGYTIGDGNFQKWSVRFRDGRLEVLEKYSKTLRNIFGLDGKISKIKDKRCYQLSLNSKLAKEILEHARYSYMPLISKSPKRHVAAFIRGFMDAEGSVRKKMGTVSMSQSNRDILQFIQLLLLRFGIISKIDYSTRAYRLQIYGTNIKLFRKFIGVTAKDKQKRLEEVEEYYTHRKEVVPIERERLWDFIKELYARPSKILARRKGQYKYITRIELMKVLRSLESLNLALAPNQASKIDFLKRLSSGDVGWQRIRRIRKLKNKSKLYDISIPGCRNFIANGCLVHNSTFRLYLRKSKEEKRIARLVDSPSMPEGEAIFKVTGKGIEDV